MISDFGFVLSGNFFSFTKAVPRPYPAMLEKLGVATTAQRTPLLLRKGTKKQLKLEEIMKPWEILGSADVPGNDSKMKLSRRDTEYSIEIDGYELMNSRQHYSEEILAERTGEMIAECHAPRVLIAGLGMGFTLAKALEHLNAAAEVIVAELIPEVIEWNNEYFAELNNRALDDPRVILKQVDVIDMLKNEEKAFNAIIMDVDNGPDSLFRDQNSWIYSDNGLRSIFRALRSSGVLAVWSLTRKNVLTRRLHYHGFEVTEAFARARGPKEGAKHTIWLAQKPRRPRKRQTNNRRPASASTHK